MFTTQFNSWRNNTCLNSFHGDSYLRCLGTGSQKTRTSDNYCLPGAGGVILCLKLLIQFPWGRKRREVRRRFPICYPENIRLGFTKAPPMQVILLSFVVVSFDAFCMKHLGIIHLYLSFQCFCLQQGSLKCDSIGHENGVMLVLHLRVDHLHVYKNLKLNETYTLNSLAMSGHTLSEVLQGLAINSAFSTRPVVI